MATRPLRLTFTQRILAALVSVVVSSAVVGSYILLSVRELETLAAEELRTHDAASAARAVETQSLSYGLALRQYVDEPDPAWLGRMDSYVLAWRADRARLVDLTRVEDVRAAAERHGELSLARIAIADSVVASVAAGDSRQVAALMERHRVLEAAIGETLAGIIDVERVAAGRARAATTAFHRTFERNVMMVMGIVVFLVTTLLYSVLLGGLTRRIRQLTRMARRVAAGDYSPSDEVVHANDELSVLMRAFDEMAGQLAEFDKVKEEFVALAAHQLRTPAAGVKGNLGLLLEGYCGPLTDEQVEVLRDADDCNERQLALISDLLVVARTDSGRLLLSKAPDDLARLLQEVVDDHRPRAAERRHRLTLEGALGDLVVDMDAQKMRMVIDNLVDNALKYTPDGGAVRVEAGSNGNGSVAFVVSDTGVGVAAADQPKMFRKFTRLPNAMSDKVGGTGLGLYLANEIVKLHGGTIRMESTPGTGTTFTVTLPKELRA